MSAKIQKWGNSLGVRIPKVIIDKTSFGEDSEVEIEHKNGAIIIFPAKKVFSLDALLDQVTKKNLHHEDDFGSEGREVW